MASWNQPWKHGMQDEPPQASYPWSKRRKESVDEVAQAQALTYADIVAAQSQDYVDERELEFRMTIQHLADEQERVQKKVFTNWMNHFLAQHDPPMRIEELIDDVRDGVKLIALIEQLSGDRLHQEKSRRLRRPHFLSNVNQVLDFLTRKRIKLVNINASDIVDGKPAITLGLVWTIILHFQIEEQTRLLSDKLPYLQLSTTSLDSSGRGASPLPSPMSPCRLTSAPPSQGATIKPSLRERWRGCATKVLLQWVKTSINKQFGIEVNDFGPSWRDGLAFLAIIHCIRPELINMNALRNASNKVRLETAFRIAEKELGVAKLLDPEDVDVPQPDQKSVMTYVAQFLRLSSEDYSQLQETDVISSLDSDKDALCQWLDKAEALYAERSRLDTATQYSHCSILKKGMTQYQMIFDQLRSSSQYDSRKTAIGMSIERRWHQIAADLRAWQKELENNLEPPLGNIVKWIYDAEEKLSHPLFPNSVAEVCESDIASALIDHVAFFKCLDGHVKTMKSLRTNIHTLQIHPEHFEEISQRLDKVSVSAHHRHLRLEFENKRQLLSDLLHSVDVRLKVWNRKYGYEPDVQKVLKEYKDFVEQKDIFKEFDRLFSETRRKAEDANNVKAFDYNDLEDISKYLNQTEVEWKKMVLELHAFGNTTEQVLLHWQQYSSLLQPVNDWLTQAESALRKNEDEQLEFFQDLPAWQNKKISVADSGDYLIATCEEPISRQIKEDVGSIRRRWDKLFPFIKDFLQSGEQIQVRHLFQKDLRKLSSWLRDTEAVLDKTIDCQPHELNMYQDKIKKLSAEWEHYDELFKKLSKLTQSLVRNLSAPEVEKVMWTLKREKEALLKVRTNLTARLHNLQQMIAPLEALNISMNELNAWLDKADETTASYGIPTNPEEIAALKEKHMSFFSVISVHKANLLNMFKIFNGILQHAANIPNTLTTDCQHRLETLNLRFESCANLAKEWETVTEDAANRWRLYHDTLHSIKEKIQGAESLMSRRPTDRQQLETHRKFFDNISESVIKKLVIASENVLATLPNDQQKPIKETVVAMQTRWQEIMKKIPHHLLEQEFRLEEQNFSNILHGGEEELRSEQQRLDSGEKTESILVSHKSYFSEHYISTVDDSIKVQKQISVEYTSCVTGDRSLLDSSCKNASKWKLLQEKISVMRVKLQKVKQDWETYHQRFNDLLLWMDSVDESIKEITVRTNCNSSAEFEIIKSHFLSVCQEVDNRREDVKWLIQKLESLLLHVSQSDGDVEQAKLDALLVRYKSLLPKIETTIVVTETVSKSFLYREEVTEVVSWLNKLKDSTETIEETVFDDPQKLEQIVAQQEAIVNQLEVNLPNVETSLQKGRLLQDENMSPEFVPQHVIQLESNWKDVYKAAVEKLSSAKNARKSWDDYEEQKNEIFRLLKQAEEELKRIPQSTDWVDSAKKREYEEIQHAAESTLQKLKTSGKDLLSRLSENQRPLLEKEVVEIEQKVHTVLTTLMESVEYVETKTQKWTNFNIKLDDFVGWVDDAIERLQKILSSSADPTEKMRKLDELCSELREKKQVLLNLEVGSEELARDQPDSKNVRDIRQQLLDLKEKIQSLEKTAIDQRSKLDIGLSNLEQLKDILKQERKEVEKAKAKVKQGSPKPTCLGDAQQKERFYKEFCAKCQRKISSLNEIGTQTGTQEVLDAAVQSEISDIQSNWGEIHITLQQWLSQLAETATLWDKISLQQEEIVKWLKPKQNVIREVSETDKAELKDLEELKEDLKKLSVEVDTKKLKVTEINRDVEDLLVPSISPKAAVVVRSQMTELRRWLTELGDNIRQQLMRSTSSIAQQETLMSTIESYGQWEIDLKLTLLGFNDIFVDQIEPVLKKIQALSVESSNKQKEFNKISEDVKKQNSEEVNVCYAQLIEHFKSTDEQLSVRQKLLQKLLDFEDWYNDVLEQVNLLLQKVEGKSPTKSELQKTEKERSKLQKEFDKKSVEVSGLHDLMTELQQTVRDRSTTKPLTIPGQMATIAELLSKLEAVVKIEEESLQQKDNQKEQFDQELKNMSIHLNSCSESIKKMKFKFFTLEELIQHHKELQMLQQNLEEQKLHHRNVHDCGRTLIEADVNSFTAVQDQLNSMDRQWEKLSTELAQRIKSVDSMVEQWKECLTLEERLQTTMKEAENSGETSGVIPADAIQVTKQLEKIKAASDNLKGQTFLMDSFKHKTRDLIDKLNKLEKFSPKIPTEMLNSIDSQWNTCIERINTQILQVETQLLLWQHIAVSKDELMNWLSEITSMMGDCLSNFADKDKALNILARYKSELPTYKSSRDELNSKITALLKLANLESIPTLTSMQTVMQDHFEEAERMAAQLEGCVSSLNEKEDALRQEQQRFSNWLKSIRERIIKCEDVTGDDSSILQQYENSKELESEILKYEDFIPKMQTKLTEEKTKHPNVDFTTLQKENESLQKRFQSVRGNLSKAMASLTSVLEHRYQSALQDFQHWLQVYSEKTLWCTPDLAGDFYSLEAKLGALQEIEMNVEQGENKKTKLDITASALLQVIPAEKIHEVQCQVEESSTGWNTLLLSVADTKLKLEVALGLWKKYELQLESFTQWLKDMEAKAKSETSQQIELEALNDQLQNVKSLQVIVQNNKSNLEELVQLTEEISKGSPEARVKNQSTQLASRYDNLKRLLTDSVNRLEDLKKRQQSYEESKQLLNVWLTEMNAKIKDSSPDVSADKEKLQSRLEALKSLLVEKERCDLLLTSVTENGELIYLGLSMEGRDRIRSEMRALKDACSAKWDQINTAIKDTEASLLAWGTFEDRY